MAEAGVEQGKWLFILTRVLALAFIGVLLWIGLEFVKWDRKTAQGEASGKSAVAPVAVVNSPAPVREFESFIRNNPAAERMNLDHDYTSGGIRRLADAIGAISDQQNMKGVDINDKLDLLRGYADRLREERGSNEHANIVSAAFNLAADLIASVEQHTPRDLKNESAELRRAAEAIDPDKPLLDQRAGVETFFDKTSRLLSEMAQRRS